MLGQRRRRWANIKPTMLQCVVFAGLLTAQLATILPTIESNHMTEQYAFTVITKWRTINTSASKSSFDF